MHAELIYYSMEAYCNVPLYINPKYFISCFAGSPHQAPIVSGTETRHYYIYDNYLGCLQAVRLISSVQPDSSYFMLFVGRFGDRQTNGG